VAEGEKRLLDHWNILSLKRGLGGGEGLPTSCHGHLNFRVWRKQTRLGNWKLWTDASADFWIFVQIKCIMKAASVLETPMSLSVDVLLYFMKFLNPNDRFSFALSGALGWSPVLINRDYHK
jgi:hypothetical protein